ncbi:MAG: hypothetical protein K2F94_10455, partial [Muribaculaceae bacterium]|nr:hypothetical protein [Muribaculaceae bacterium]
MTQSFEIMADTETEIWNFFQDYAASLSPATASAYGKAIRSAREYFSFNAAPDVSDVADWVVAAIEISLINITQTTRLLTNAYAQIS